MKIKDINEDRILFDNGNTITFNDEKYFTHGDKVYADFEVISKNDVNYDYDFDEELEFRYIDELGFLFGCYDADGFAHFILVPCYVWYGYYNTLIDILYNGKPVLEYGNVKRTYV